MIDVDRLRKLEVASKQSIFRMTYDNYIKFVCNYHK